ncbi:MAG: tRNA uridine-5-carboxymethylaminomethyl(34) synthesis GTPase MnmE, partial [Clostridia bacterium]
MNQNSQKKADDIKPNSAIYGKFFDENGVFDDGIAIFYCAPKSFTGENTVELCCHGGLLVTQKLLETAIAAGADYAAAGEFTKRAFINGRLTLSEAEAVGGIIDAKSEAYLKTSLLQLDGALSRKINVVFGKLSFLAASVYAYIDYPDEDLTDVSAEEMKVMLQNILEELELLYKTRNYGKAISEGISTAIVGRPNTGKSSVLNFLAGEECAIVTDIEGTTRDVVTEQVKIGNVILNLADTAGIRKSDDLVEKIGISRSLERIEKSEIIFLVLDGDITPEDQEIIKLIKQNKKQSKTIVLYNKSDINMPKLQGMFENEVAFSAKTGSGRSELEKMTAKLCGESE